MNIASLLLAAGLAFAAAPPDPPPELKGTVLEVHHAGTYSYLRLKTSAGEVWAAVPRADVKKGAQAVVVGSAEMKDFESKSLKRKFARILFGTLGGSAAAQAPAETPSPAQPAHGGRPEVKAGPVKVEKAAGPGARTVAEVHAQRAELKGKEVVVRGTIVRMNSHILQRNWAHLRDGTGLEKDGTDDLTVLLLEEDEPAEGQVVTVRGKVALDLDLKGMYQFPVVLEDASLVK